MFKFIKIILKLIDSSIVSDVFAPDELQLLNLHSNHVKILDNLNKKKS